MKQRHAQTIPWDDATYWTSHPLIDSQHHTIVGLYNTLVELSLQEPISSVEYARILFALDHQLSSHFSVEESIFLQHQHPLFKNHQEKHGELVQILATHADDHDTSSITLLIQQLYDWFSNNLEQECRAIRQLVGG